MAPSVTLFGPIDTLVGPYIEYLLLGLVVLNMGARAIEYDRHVEQAADEPEAVTRHPVRVATNFLLVIGAFYYTTLHYHGGFVFSMLVVGLFLTDVFEFESRTVEARQDMDLERPKGSLAASTLVLLYIAYQTLFFIIKPAWNAVI